MGKLILHWQGQITSPINHCRVFFEILCLRAKILVRKCILEGLRASISKCFPSRSLHYFPIGGQKITFDFVSLPKSWLRSWTSLIVYNKTGLVDKNRVQLLSRMYPSTLGTLVTLPWSLQYICSSFLLPSSISSWAISTGSLTTSLSTLSSTSIVW